MNYKDILAMADAYKEVAEASAKQRALANVKAQPKDKVSLAKAPWEKKKATKKEEAEIEEALDAVNKKAVKKDFADRKDKDIDNDGDTDSSDEYLHKRRKAVSKAMKGKEVEVQANEEVELEEQKTPYIVVDTADGNKVVAMASDEKGAKSSIFHAERPPMSIKDKSTLKVVKSNKKQSIGYQLKEDVEITELTAAEKKLIAQMYDKKGNLTPLGKKVMDHGKESVDLTKEAKELDEDLKMVKKEEDPKGGYIVTLKDKKGKLIKRHLKNGKVTNKLTKEEVELDEASRRKGAPKMTGDSITIQRAKDAEHNKAMGRTKTGRKKPVRTMTSTQRSLASMRNEEVELDENKTAKMLHKHMLKALGKSKLPKDHGYTSSVATNGDFVVSKGGSVAGRLKKGEHDVPAKMSETVDEAKDHGNTDNGSKAGEGLSPSAKKELDRKTPMLPATDETTVDNLNFKTFKTMTKKAPMRSGDNASGDKTAPKTGK
jgi:hypothetical protein